MKCPRFGIICQGADCKSFDSCAFVMAENEATGDNHPTTSNGLFKIPYTEVDEIKLSQQPSSKYYKGSKITLSEVEDFIIDLNRETSYNIIKRLKAKSTWKSTKEMK
jgi:hypothetical protein